VRGQTDRIRVLDDGDCRRRVVARDAVCGVQVEQVVERRPATLQLGRVGERPATVRRLAVEGRVLVRVLAVAQVVDLLQHQGQAPGELVAGDLIEVGRDLGVVGGDRAERLGRQPGPGLRADHPALADLVGHQVVLVRRRDGRHASGIAGGGTQQGCAADVDHLDGLVDGHQASADRRRERLHVDGHDVDRADALRFEFGKLLGHVAAGQDAGVHRRMEGLDLPTDERRDLGQVADAADLHAIGREGLASAVGGHDLHPERLQAAGEGRDTVSIGDGQQGSHDGRFLPSRRGSAGATPGSDVRPGRCFGGAWPPSPSIAVGMAYSGHVPEPGLDPIILYEAAA